MKTKKNQRKGISLIVLIVTIIVMIILAGAIILTLNNSGVIGRAEEATEKTNEQAIKEAANMAYGDWVLAKQMDNETRSADEYVKSKLKEQGFRDEQLENLVVTDDGKITIIKNDDTNEIISFTIGDQSYTAESGMTWEEWVNSSYNINNFSISTRPEYLNCIMITDHSGASSYYVKDEDKVLSSHIIKSGYAYEMVYGYSNN